MKQILSLLLAIMIAYPLTALCAADKGVAEVFPYIMTGITDYDGQYRFHTQSVGRLDITRQRDTASGNWHYTTQYKSVLSVGKNQEAVRFNPPPLTVICDPDNRRLAGGFDFLRNFGEISNTAMDKAGKQEYSGSRRVKVPMDTTPLYPSSPAFKISYKQVNSKVLGPCLIASAVSDMFACNVPDSDKLLTGTHRVIVICDPEMKNLYFRLSAFNSTHNSEKFNAFDQFWLTGRDGKSVDLSDIMPEVENMAKTFSGSSGDVAESNGTIPPWVVHAMVVRKYMDAVSGAVIEGKPNIVEIATVGSILAVDAVVSIGTKIFSAGVNYTTGYTPPVWEGIPTYFGWGVGGIAATAWQKLSGKNVNVGNWMTVGGDAASIASMIFSLTTKGAELAAIKIINSLPAGTTVPNVILQITTKGGKVLQMTSAQEKIISIIDGIKTVGEALNNQKNIWFPSSQYTGIKGSSVAGGGLSFSPARFTESITAAAYDPSENSFLVNHKFKYRVPVSPDILNKICKSVIKNHGFGYSLAEKGSEQYSASDDIGSTLNVCDHFLGSVAFGNLAGIPAGCSPAPSYQSHPAALAQAFPYCFNMNVIYQFKTDRNNALRAVSKSEIGFVPAAPEKAERGVWELDKAAQKTGFVPSGLEANARHLVVEWPYYAQTGPVAAMLNYGEAAAFCMLLQNSGIKLNKLVSE